MDNVDKIIREVFGQLNQVFRHLLPGLLVVTLACVAHPSLFKRISFSNGWQLFALGAVSLVVGNAWYVLHRYSIHQLIDFGMYLCSQRYQGSEKFGRTLRGYCNWLAKFLPRSFAFEQKEVKLAGHLRFRSAQVIFLFVLGEALILFEFSNESGSWFSRHPWLAGIVGASIFAVAFVQYVISDYLDGKIVEDSASSTSS
jgi:hypothetical protein